MSEATLPCPYCRSSDLTALSEPQPVTTTISVAQPPYSIERVIGWNALFHCGGCNRDVEREVKR